jgi:putative transposon-encoded protein
MCSEIKACARGAVALCGNCVKITFPKKHVIDSL